MKTKSKILALLIILLLIIANLAPFASAATMQDTGSLTIIKQQYKNGSTGEYEPLAGVQFKVYKVEDVTNAGTTITQAQASAMTEATADATYGNGQLTSLTDSTGKTVLNNLAIGRYLVMEVKAPENVETYITPFLVDIPMTTDNGTGLNYNVTVQPKNNTVYGTYTVTVTDKNDPSKVLPGVSVKLQVYDEDTQTWNDYTGTAITASSIVTDENGQVTFTNMPKGTYRVVETALGDTVSGEGYILDSKTPTTPYTVTPTTLTGTGSLVNEKPSATKAITAINGNTSNVTTASFEDTISYKLQTKVPANIADLKEFKVTDTTDTGLVVNVSTVTVSDLTKGTDYTVAQSGQNTEITFDPTKLIGGNTLTITYTAKLNGNGTTASYKNKATLAYDTTDNDTVVVEKTVDASNATTGEDEDTPVDIAVGGIFVDKRAQTTTGAKLAGAEFKLATSEADAKAGTFIKIPGTTNDIVFTSNSNGEAKYFGLAYGDYYLVETKAPTVGTDTYNLLAKPVKVTVNATSAQTAVVVVNKLPTILPQTGGIGAIIFIVAGIAFIGTGIVLVTKNKKETK